MLYRELHRMEIEEVVRRWQVGESQRAIVANNCTESFPPWHVRRPG
jgi:hypothetical protein